MASDRQIPDAALEAAVEADVECQRDNCKRRDCNGFLCIRALEAVYANAERDGMRRTAERLTETEMAEAGAANMYGSKWNSPTDDERPGEKMKDVWRKYARDCLVGVAAILSEAGEP